MKASIFFWLDRGRGKKKTEKCSPDSNRKLGTALLQKISVRCSEQQ